MSMGGYERLVEPHLADVRRARARYRRRSPLIPTDLAKGITGTSSERDVRRRLGIVLVDVGLWLMSRQPKTTASARFGVAPKHS